MNKLAFFLNNAIILDFQVAYILDLNNYPVVAVTPTNMAAIFSRWPPFLLDAFFNTQMNALHFSDG